MRFVSVQQMRAADAAAMRLPECGGLSLMLRAGNELARVVARVSRLRGTRRVVLVAGHGNNGGDIFVAATGLHRDGFSVQVLLTCSPDILKGDALSAFRILERTGVPCLACPAESDWDAPELRTGFLLRDGVVVDGVLGTGCRGAPRGTAARAIRWINEMRRCACVVAADIPSGMNGDTGEIAGDCVTADCTVTFARPKAAFAFAPCAERIGSLSVADIGMPDSIADADTLAEVAGVQQLIAEPELRRWLPPRPWDANKGTFGKLCIVGGSRPYPHAPVLAGLGARASGVGLICLQVPEESRTAAAVHLPEAILREYTAALDGYDAVVFGPGRGAPSAEERFSVRARRLVIDADGLNLLAQTPNARPAEETEWILTPHPGEAARLLGVSVADVQKDRPAAVAALASRYRAVAVLKGAGTLVCEPDGKPWLNRTGNPGMASAGSGDVLAGLIGGWWAQGIPAFAAACIGVWSHGKAGDLAALTEGQSALSARSIIAHLPAGRLTPPCV
ncbi:MAG: NAD(P)H-hydrate dehydratase [Kiritimatiellae bacterium]|nr:NAD(P)H-hydrate dehydratase [Kiritimatiellia bacterium]